MTDYHAEILRFGCQVRAEGLRLKRGGHSLSAKTPVVAAPYFEVIAADQPAEVGDAFLARRRVGYEWNEFFLFLHQTVPMDAAMALVYALTQAETEDEPSIGEAAPRQVREASVARLGRMSVAYTDLAGGEMGRRLTSAATELLPSRAFVEHAHTRKRQASIPPDPAHESLDLVYFWTLFAREAFLAALNDRIARKLGDKADTVIYEHARTNPVFVHLSAMPDGRFLDFIRHWHREIEFPAPACRRLLMDIERMGIRRVALPEI